MQSANPPAQTQSSGALFSGMNLGGQSTQNSSPFGGAPAQQPGLQQQSNMGLFDGLNQNSTSASSATPAPSQQPQQPSKPTMWDTNSKLFDLSADSLKQT